MTKENFISQCQTQHLFIHEWSSTSIKIMSKKQKRKYCYGAQCSVFSDSHPHALQHCISQAQTAAVFLVYLSWQRDTPAQAERHLNSETPGGLRIWTPKSIIYSLMVIRLHNWHWAHLFLFPLSLFLYFLQKLASFTSCHNFILVRSLGEKYSHHIQTCFFSIRWIVAISKALYPKAPSGNFDKVISKKNMLLKDTFESSCR